MSFENNELDDYELSISNIISLNSLPHSNQSHYEFIMIDRKCDYSMDVLKLTGKGIDDYSWIIWSFQSNQVINFVRLKSNLTQILIHKEIFRLCGMA